jgi:hypothetical protein
MADQKLAEYIVTRWQPVRDGAGVKGLEIGMVGVPASGPATRLVCDENERDDGHIRIVSVVGRGIPKEWQDKSRTGEYWTDVTGLLKVTDSPVVGEVKLLVTRSTTGQWSVSEIK